MDTVQSYNEDETDELMNDTDAEFTAPEEIELTDNPENVSVLTAEASVYVAGKETTHTKELETDKKRKKSEEDTPSHGNAIFLHILERIVFLRTEFFSNLTKILQLSISMNKLLILMFWLTYLFNEATSIRNKKAGVYTPILGKSNLSLVSVT